jgi:hypothetical protein
MYVIWIELDCIAAVANCRVVYADHYIDVTAIVYCADILWIELNRLILSVQGVSKITNSAISKTNVEKCRDELRIDFDYSFVILNCAVILT